MKTWFSKDWISNVMVVCSFFTSFYPFFHWHALKLQMREKRMNPPQSTLANYGNTKFSPINKNMGSNPPSPNHQDGGILQMKEMGAFSTNFLPYCGWEKIKILRRNGERNPKKMHRIFNLHPSQWKPRGWKVETKGREVNKKKKNLLYELSWGAESK